MTNEPPTESVAAFLASRDKLPICYALVMNSIWERMEHRAIVALFDTEAMAAAYEQGCRLADYDTEILNPGTLDERRMVRHYREGTMLRDFNVPHDFNGPHIIPAPVDYDYRKTPINPVAPSDGGGR